MMEDTSHRTFPSPSLFLVFGHSSGGDVVRPLHRLLVFVVVVHSFDFVSIFDLISRQSGDIQMSNNTRFLIFPVSIFALVT